MKQAMVLGGTGTAGSAVLRQCLENEDFVRVISLHRRATGIDHPKLQESIHADFTDYSATEPLLARIDICFFCLGISQQKEKDLNLFWKVTHDYPVAIAKALFKANPDVTLCFLSGAGADPTGKSHIPFARAKGAAENSLREIGLKHLYIFRPGYIHSDTPHPGRILGERISGTLYPLLKTITPGFVIHADELAAGMIHVGLHGYSKQLLNNKMIKAAAKANPVPQASLWDNP